MEPQPSESSNPLMQNERWYPCFEAHGVDERYFEKWFGNFSADQKEQKEVLETVKKGYSDKAPMIFLGKFGNGKTHLAASMVKNTLMTGKEAYYYTVSTLFRDYRASLNDPDFSERKFFNRLFTCEVLVIDEINIRSDSQAENRIIQEIIDRRYSKMKQTIFIANMDIEEFTEVITERLLDRLRGQGAEVLTFNWGSYRPLEVKTNDQ